jgi:hypothetical protein
MFGKMFASDGLFGPKGSISLLSLLILSKLRFLDRLVHSLGQNVGNKGLMECDEVKQILNNK